MIRAQADVAILGAGFAGSLMALVLRRLGRSVLLIERGAQPRFAIGESSTPQANLLLEGLATTYDLPRLTPLARYGSWQQTYPQLACGLKRGFTFFRHEPGKPFVPRADHSNELLVGASSSDEVSDTHWFREHVDYFLLNEAVSAGVAYYDRTAIVGVEGQAGGWRLTGHRGSQPATLGAAFLIDASGPAGALSQAFHVPTAPDEVLTHSWSVYSHFADVPRFEHIYRVAGGNADAHPYPCDDAALHHVMDDGWMWVLRFNNGLTSAGPVWNGVLRPPSLAQTPEVEWEALLQRYPSLAAQFGNARPVRPFVRTGRLQRWARRATGPGWVLLPHAAYFLDPLLSAGNAHTLLGIERLGRLLEAHWGRPSLDPALVGYERILFRERQFLDRLVHGCYQTFGRFDLLVPYTMYYFAGAIHSEGRRRRREAEATDEFLFSHDDAFRTAVWHAHDELTRLVREPPGQRSAQFAHQVVRDIARLNSAGLCDPDRHNLYPFV